ncbi:hypothetical protein OE88DRAFT_1715923 [Heliocybe sulcata]|uniref:Pentacotripeptide-repeat region of PRORP domain-containing protein n=1 Tax=Heliocybe sulcata TaxID=5364 RepID=A0A5C3NHK6_9AGAM|nr:hypothetical protein OE88DRAFT_1715923 [Heliocybe sulcata]
MACSSSREVCNWSILLSNPSRGKGGRPARNSEARTLKVLTKRKERGGGGGEAVRSENYSDTFTGYPCLDRHPVLSGSLQSLCIGLPEASSSTGNLSRAEKAGQYLAASPFPEKALKLLRIIHKIGYELRPRTYEAVVHQLVKGQRWNLILQVVNLARLHIGRSSIRLLNWRTLALLQLGHYTLLDMTLDAFQRDGLDPNRTTFHLLITGHIRNRDLGKARLYLYKMEQAGIPVDSSTYATVVSVYRSLGPDLAVQTQAMNALPAAEAHIATRILNSLMQFGIDAHDADRVVEVMSMFDQDSWGPQNVAAADGDSMPSIGASDHQTKELPRPLSPNASTAARLISFMSKQRDLPGVLQIFYRMQAAGVVPDARVAAALVRAHVSLGDEATAVRLVADMCPSNVPRSLLIPIGLARDGLPAVPVQLPQSLLTVHVLNALLKGVVKSHRIRGFIYILRIMRIVAIQPDAHTLNILLHYLESTEGVQDTDALRILRSLSGLTPAPTLKLVHKVLKVALRRDSSITRRAGRIRNGARRRPMLSATAATTDPTAGIRARRTAALVMPLIKSLVSRGVRNDAAVYALRIRHDAIKGDMDGARSVLRDMVARGIHPNEYHYSALMAGYAMSGDLSVARGVMREAAAAGVAPNVVLYTILIHGHARHGQMGLALRTFDKMVEAGVKPDFTAVDTLVRASLARHQYDTAKKILLNLWTLVAPFPEEAWHRPLESLVEEFRSLPAAGHRVRKKALSKRASRMLRWKLVRLRRQWELTASQPSPQAMLSQVQPT